MLLRSMHVKTVSFMMWERPPTSTLSLPDAQRTAAAVQRFFDDPRERPAPHSRWISGHRQRRSAIHLRGGACCCHETGRTAGDRSGGTRGCDHRYPAHGGRRQLLGRSSDGSRSPSLCRVVSDQSRLGLKASLEMLVPIGIGAALGWSCGVGLVALIGPSSAFGSAAITEALWLVLGGAVVGLILLGLVAGLRARLGTEQHRRISGVPLDEGPTGGRRPGPGLVDSFPPRRCFTRGRSHIGPSSADGIRRLPAGVPGQLHRAVRQTPGGGTATTASPDRDQDAQVPLLARHTEADRSALGGGCRCRRDCHPPRGSSSMPRHSLNRRRRP